MARFIIYDTRHYIIEAETDDEAFDKWCDLSLEESLRYEVDGGQTTLEELA